MARDKSVYNWNSGPNAARTGGIARARVRSGAQNRAGFDGVQRCGGGCCGVTSGLQICSDSCVRIFMAGGLYRCDALKEEDVNELGRVTSPEICDTSTLVL